MKSLYEELAEIEHQRWADWQAYLFSRSEWTKDGYIIPRELCMHWQRQIDTPYSLLSEKEKDSDREQVDRYVPLIIERIKGISATDDNGVWEFLKEQIVKLFKR